MEKNSLRDDFEALFKRHYQDLVLTSYRITSHRPASEDIVQDLFVYLWKNSLSLRISGSIESYLKRATINRSLNWLRDEQRTKLYAETPESVDRDSTSDVSDERLVKLKEAIQALPEKCRLIFMLHRYEGLTTKEIANYLDLSPKTIENQLGKALKLLREKIS